MTVEQFVMAYGAEQDRLRACCRRALPRCGRCCASTRRCATAKRGLSSSTLPRKKTTIAAGSTSAAGTMFPFTKDGKKTTFTLPELTISFTGVGIEGGCPAEKDNVGCYYLKDGTFTLVPAEKITANKEFCDCEFAWRFAGARTVSALAKRCPPSPKRRRRTMKRRLSRSKMPPSSPARRCWGPIR